MINFICEPVYHYTTEECVTSIIKENEIVLRLTKSDSLSDKTEGKEIFKHIKIAYLLQNRNGQSCKKNSPVLQL